MDIVVDENSATLKLAAGESFFVKKEILRGFGRFDWKIIPPFPLGSPIVRLWYGSYWLRKLRADVDSMKVPLRGYHPRGNFYALKMLPGRHYFVNGHHLAGFSSDIGGLHTHIKFGLNFWLLRHHFFPVFTGPGIVVIYSECRLESSDDLEFQPERIVTFDIARKFHARAVQPKDLVSHVINVFSSEVIWEFCDPGLTIATRHAEMVEENENKHFIRRLLEHLLGFFRF